MVKLNDNPTLRLRIIAYAFTLSHDNLFHPGSTPDSSDGDERRSFWGLKFSILGFRLGGKTWQVFFGVT